MEIGVAVHTFDDGSQGIIKVKFFDHAANGDPSLGQSVILRSEHSEEAIHLSSKEQWESLKRLVDAAWRQA